MVPFDRIDMGSGGRGVAENAGIAEVYGNIEELHGVSTARRQQRSTRVHEAHP